MLTSTKLQFVVPDPDLFQSGGNLYNAHLIEALKKKKIDARIIDFEQLETGERERTEKIYFIDTLYLDHIRLSNPYLKNCFLIVHHLDSLYPPESGAEVFEKKERQILQGFGGFLASSSFTRQYLVEKGFGDRQFIVVNPALCFDPDLEQKSTDSVNAVIVANLIERKGIYPFLQSLRRSNIQPKNCQIQIAGSVDFEPEYAQKCLDLIASDKRLSKIIKYSGACDSEQIQQLYRQSNLFISASFMETFGMALQEAVAFRLPILAINGGNTGYHIEAGKNGFVFDSMNDLMNKLEAFSLDKLAMNKIVETAWHFRKFEQYDWDDAAGLFLKQLHQYVADRI